MSDRGPWIQTYTGRRFYFLDPDPDEVDLQDIAHAIARINRFTGHAIGPGYSVATHCVACSLMATDVEVQILALLHDAHEAYVGDMSAPCKQALRALGDCAYDVIERRAENAVRRALLPDAWWATDRDLRETVSEIDLRMCVTEINTFLPQPACSWGQQIEPYPNIVLRYQNPEIAEQDWLLRWDALKAKCA